VKVWPATVSVPVREAATLADAANATDPFPLPDAPDVIVSHAELLLTVAVQVQPLAAVTVTDPDPPSAGRF
jgi:hypothetical protein